MKNGATERAPLVSVLMAAYNREKYVREAMRSILDQDLSDLELIVTDDGSTDATPDILSDVAAQDNRVRVFRQPNAGVAAARNHALAQARGEYIAIMDSDDLCAPERLRLQTRYLTCNPEVAGVGSRYFFIDAQGRRIGPRRYVSAPDAPPEPLPCDPEDVRTKLLAKGVVYFLHSTATFRAKALRDIGGYRTLFRAAEDSDVHLRLLTGGWQLANLEELLFFYRLGGGNLSTVNIEVLINRMTALAAAHRRLLGLDDLVDARREPLNQPFLMEVMRPVGLPLWLEWIGLLQYHRCGSDAMLIQAWSHVQSLIDNPDHDSEALRHWRAFAKGWAEPAAAIAGAWRG